MRCDLYSRYVTLDWDNITKTEAVERFKLITDWNDPIYLGENNKLVDISLSTSPLGKGYHVRGWYLREIHVLSFRALWLDDPKHIIHDILNRREYIHDILWKRKVVNGQEFNENTIMTMRDFC